jgi:hypothetical protein
MIEFELAKLAAKERKRLVEEVQMEPFVEVAKKNKIKHVEPIHLPPVDRPRH